MVYELTESSILQDQHITKLKEVYIEEASQGEDDLYFYIMKQEEVLEKAIEEIMKLRNHLANLKSIHTRPQSTQTPINKTVMNHTQHIIQKKYSTIIIVLNTFLLGCM